jgi:hypothetical protein
MLKCKIIFNGVEYTSEEFKDYVLVNGVGSLLGDSPTKLALDIVSKYEVKDAEESVSEMWARLEIERKTGKTFGKAAEYHSTYLDSDLTYVPDGATMHSLLKQLVKEYPEREKLNTFLNKVIKDVSDVPIVIGRESANRAGVIASYNPGKKVINLNDNEIELATIVHEITHAYVFSTFDAEDKKDLTDLFEIFKDKYAKDSNGRTINKAYGFKNIDEFLSEILSNKDFYDEVKDLKLSEKDIKHYQNETPIWINRLLNKIIKIYEDLFLSKYKFDKSFVDNVTEYFFDLNLEGSRERFLTREEVDAEINPSGQLTDYAVQEEIRYNTYAGIDLTGISANFGKTLGYVLDASPVSVVKNILTGEFYETGLSTFKDLLKQEGVYSVEALLEKSNIYKVENRETIAIDAKYSFSIDGTKIDKIQRNTIPELSWKGRLKNVFETIDTVINLAIDNVKEQKLNVLGVTGTNANTYLSMLATGIPLNIVSKIFKTPVLMQANDNSRWTVKIIEENYLDPAIQELLALPEADLLVALTSFTGSEAKAKSIAESLQNKDAKEVLGKLGIKTDVLDAVYTAKASNGLKLLSDISVLSAVQKTIPVGEEFFEYAQVFSALRGLPNKKWQTDSLISKIEAHNEFSDEINVSSDIKKAMVLDLTKNFKEQSAEYKEILEKNEEEAEQFATKAVEEAVSGKKGKLFGTVTAAIRASFVNRVLRGGVNKRVKEGQSVFENVAILRIPHVFAAYKTLLQLRSILENSFAVYNPVVQTFVKDLLKEANIYTGSDELEKVDVVSKELVKFLASNLTFNIENKEFSTDVPENTEYYAASSYLRGKEAWAQTFADKTLKLVDSPDMATNAFVRSLEIPVDLNGLHKIQIVADKVNDEEVLEQIRDAFLQLTQDNSELSPGYTKADWAQDMFKYALMSEAMYYEKTGFALIFPSHWVVKYGVALENRLNSIIPKGESKTDLNLAILRDRFMFQFLKNNANLVSKTVRQKPVLQSTTKTAGKEQQSFAGYEDGVYFDLKYEKPYSPTSAKFLRRYDDSIYILINTPNSPYSYYAKITEKTSSKFYHFEPSEIDESLDFTLLQSGKHPIVNLSSIVRNELITDFKTHVFTEGQVVAAFPKSSSSGNSLRYYKINKVSKLSDKIVYKVTYVDSVKITKADEAVNLKDFMARFLDENLGTTVPVESLKEYRSMQFKNKRARLLANESTDESTAIKLPITELPPNATPEELADITNYILSAIEKLDGNLNYYVDANILSPLNSNALVRNKIANALRAKIGFLEPFREREEEQSEKRTALITALKEREIISWMFGKNTTINAVEGFTHTHEAEIKREMKNKNLKAGQLVGAGQNKYFYIMEVENNTLKLIEFGEEVFQAIQSDSLELKDFLQIYSDKIKC